MGIMSKMIRTYAAPLLLCAGAAFSQPVWDEGESFEAFRDEWNGWVETLPDDQRMYHDLAEVIEQIWENERNNKLSEEIGAIAKPDMIRFTAALPKTRSGKIMRRLLRSIAAGETEITQDVTTLEDFSVVAKLAEKDEG
jgi:acyl-CoA synthetase (AMP-forming)/AMP-acid ligase II